MSDLLQRLLNHSGELLIATDEAGAVVEVNAAGERLLGWTRDELLGRRLAELRHVDDREATGEWRLRRKDGGYRWFVWTANRSGGVTLHAGRDVTEERVVLDPLAPLLTLFAGLADFAAIVDPRGQVLHLNAAAQRFAGAEASETTLDQLTPNAARMIGECGACVQIDGPSGQIVVKIVDSCPGCAPGDIDLSEGAFPMIAAKELGRVPISWRYVSCATDGPIVYHFKEGSNQWWTAVQIRGHKNPIASLEYKDAMGQWKAVARVDYNYFVEDAGMGPGPYSFRVTDTEGHVLEDSGIPFVEAGDAPGAGQFPACGG